MVLVPQTVVVAGKVKFNASTVTVIASVHATPFTVVVHVYVVVAVGETVIDGVVAPPGDQEYVIGKLVNSKYNDPELSPIQQSENEKSILPSELYML